jgi:hypothetical protein
MWESDKVVRASGKENKGREVLLPIARGEGNGII